MISCVRVEREEPGIARVVWDRREAANSFDENLVEELVDAIEQLGTEVALLVLHGEGGRFSAGFDLGGQPDDAELAWRFGRAEHLLNLVRSAPAVTVALVTGPAFGLGADLVASCDYRVGDPTARFRFPGPRFGVVLGTDVLGARVGAARATDILLRNSVVPAETAQADGLLTELLDAAEHNTFVRALADQVAHVGTEMRVALLDALRPRVRHESGSRLLASTHVSGLAARVDAYRNRALAQSVGSRPQGKASEAHHST